MQLLLNQYIPKVPLHVTFCALSFSYGSIPFILPSKMQCFDRATLAVEFFFEFTYFNLLAIYMQ